MKITDPQVLHPLCQHDHPLLITCGQLPEMAK